MTDQIVDKIKNLVDAVPNVLEIDGKKYTNIQLNRIAEFDPRPKAFRLTTLTGMRDYLLANVEEVDHKKLIVHVVDYKTVAVRSAFEGEDKSRTAVLDVAMDDNLKTFSFGEWLSTEDFILRARTLFQGNDAMDELVKYASLVKAEDGVELSDNGVSTTMQIKRSVRSGMTDEVTTTGFYTLIPYRTFREIHQVESLFLFRMRVVNGEIKVALFEADGGAWRLEAVQRVAEWIKDQVKTVVVIA